MLDKKYNSKSGESKVGDALDTSDTADEVTSPLRLSRGTTRQRESGEVSGNSPSPSRPRLSSGPGSVPVDTGGGVPPGGGTCVGDNGNIVVKGTVSSTSKGAEGTDSIQDSKKGSVDICGESFR